MDATREAADGTSVQLVALRALCLLIEEGRCVRAGSITVDVGREDGAVLNLVRAARQVAGEFGIHQRTELRAHRATVHVWRKGAEARASTSPQYLAFQY
jgi:hypothetical protein